MNSIRKKAGFLEGLIASMKPDEKDPSMQLNMGVVSLLSDMAERIEAMDELIAELNDYVESIDDDLTELEGMHDEEDNGDIFDFKSYPAEEHEPFRVIENAAEPETIQMPARCPECSAVFMTDGGAGKYICPVCEKAVKPQRLTKKNTPIARKADK